MNLNQSIFKTLWVIKFSQYLKKLRRYLPYINYWLYQRFLTVSISLWRDRDSWITHHSKRLFGIFRTTLPRLPERHLKKHMFYRLPYYIFLPPHWLAIWRIFRRSPLSEDKYPNRKPDWKQAMLIIDFQGFTIKSFNTSLSAAYHAASAE